jgi:rubredoxin
MLNMKCPNCRAAMNRQAQKVNYTSMARSTGRPNVAEGFEEVHTCPSCGHSKTQIEVARRDAAPAKVWRFTYAGLL